ncbi:MAG: hypothetical protein RDU89_06855 [bacterium]|nr:hypothetical protein [bacterium]
MTEQTTALDLSRYPRDRYNVLVPTTTMQQISPWHRQRVEEVRINPDPVAGEVFKVGSQQVAGQWRDVLSLSKVGIMRLAAAAGIIWNWNETRVLSASRDYVLYQAVGAMRKPSGEWIPLKATKEIDLPTIEVELRQQTQEKAEKQGKGPDWVEKQVAAAMIQWRKNKLMRAETGAMLRVVRALLAIKHQYSPAELQKPFVVPRVDFAPDPNDPEVRRMMLAQGAQAMNQLFGGHTLPPQLMGGQEHGATAPPSLPPAIDVSPEPENEPIDADWTPADEGGGPEGDGGSVDQEPGAEGLFPPSAPPEAEPANATRRPSRGKGSTSNQANVVAHCSQCGAGITSSKVVEYSMRRFGRELCYKCQEALKEEGGRTA